ncbi:MAG TPA: hydroxymethylglutaryl-CoA synthase [Candidatus Latescibacteria bacterium]|jgi:hydroxymethylglutaryl-CoA synthase|nr:3-hydroxy-3-methylglutaryl-ACP synthase [Gemmatimonadaceae bacterium]MDP6017765.1 hydroxymethylglutaryl-CoA synthase [Candidatus Latescibacterota bacterium]HJP29905.1 hydroxymethylglutaryl-CoA synthase [Candidatus Latescibacterota bacterium]
MPPSPVGIEAINLYGSTLCMKQADLARARGRDPHRVVHDYLIDTRSLLPPWEDTVTMAANASRPLLEVTDPERIGLFVMGTEGGLDFGKSTSTQVHAALGLHANVRNYEIKHACYGGAAAVDAAVNWIASGLNRGPTALVIAADFSRQNFGEEHEFMLGASAVAAVLGDVPRVLAFEPEVRGTWTTHAYDTYRPTARMECGNSKESLFTYLDALTGSWEHYLSESAVPVDFATHFEHLVYHMPFPGMAFQAHRTLSNLGGRRSKQEVQADFDRRVSPSRHFPKRLGSQYSASNLAGLCGLLAAAPQATAGDRIGFFAYGSGAIGEFYSGLLGEEARQVLSPARWDEQLDARRQVTPEEYELVERTRDTMIEASDVDVDLSLLDAWYDRHYDGRGLLTLNRIRNHQRSYVWS